LVLVCIDISFGKAECFLSFSLQVEIQSNKKLLNAQNISFLGSYSAEATTTATIEE